MQSYGKPQSERLAWDVPRELVPSVKQLAARNNLAPRKWLRRKLFEIVMDELRNKDSSNYTD